jgi:hypothetical protein
LRSGNTRGIALASMIVVIGATSVSAHRRDELLQAARIGIAADRIELELSLTPGIAVADDILGAIDRDHNGMLSSEEKGRYTEQVMAATELRIDGRIVKMAVSTAMYPLLDELRDGDRSIEFRLTAAFPELSSGRHEIAFSNSYRNDISIYLANALKPDSDRIVIASQHRDRDQQRLAIDFTIDTGRFTTLPIGLFGSGVVAWLRFRRRLVSATAR